MFLEWIKKYKAIDENTQLFDRDFQRLTPLFFWEKKVPVVSQYFRSNELDSELNNKMLSKVAYAISQEWASAGVPVGELTVIKKKVKWGKHNFP